MNLMTECCSEGIFSFQVAVDIFTVVLVGKLIEPLWGALEMMTFFFIVNTGKSLVPVLLL